jgi:hypothetical protein
MTAPQNGAEAERMAALVALAGEPEGRCGTCALRPGTDANRSRMVVHLIESCLRDETNTFMCHHGHEDGSEPSRPCAGFVALRKLQALARR